MREELARHLAPGERLEGLRCDKALRLGGQDRRHLVPRAHEQPGQLTGLVGRDPARDSEKHPAHTHILPCAGKSTEPRLPYSLRHRKRRGMNRKHAAIIAICIAGALAAAGSAFSGRASTPTLKGVVGPGYSISLKLGGKKVKTLRAGTYKIVVSDKSSLHNFTLEREHPSKPKP